jgi:dephospho-CoA kinase
MQNPSPPRIIGLLGGVAAGKSTVARLFGEAGFVVIDADQIAREVSRQPRILAAIRAAFGPQALTEAGELDRQFTASRVFGDNEAKARLESILHPPVHAEIERRMATSLAAGTSVVLDVPLLLETGWGPRCTDLVFVDTPVAVRRERAAVRGWDAGEVDRREQTQMSPGVKQSAAGYIVQGTESLEQTRRQVRLILTRMTSPQ